MPYLGILGDTRIAVLIHQPHMARVLASRGHYETKREDAKNDCRSEGENKCYGGSVNVGRNQSAAKAVFGDTTSCEHFDASGLPNYTKVS
ncbi:unnamed protein product [Protopolystoma xenopodis]|uniref:Uncharacterized protein n=1 Tax=Protopolystoma xenopodis TaxID=117903 RepID=A0A3S5FFU9_9PLAT|nr:unnamed protein product [Protopolystoma xenopodis]